MFEKATEFTSAAPVGVMDGATDKTVFVSDSSTKKPEFHPESNDPTANLVVKSGDGVSFRLHDYYLKANRNVPTVYVRLQTHKNGLLFISPVFRDMLVLSASSTDNAIPLPEFAKDLIRLFRILTGKIVAVDAMQIDFADSVILYKLAKKYDSEASFRLWMTCLLQRSITSNAMECFVIACEQSPADTILAHAAILCFSIGSKPFVGVEKMDWENRVQLCMRPSTFAAMTNPANCSDRHIQRIGLHHYSGYVRAWYRIIDTSCDKMQTKPSDKLLQELADNFVSEIQK